MSPYQRDTYQCWATLAAIGLASLAFYVSVLVGLVHLVARWR